MLIYINPQDIQNFLKFKKKKILPITETSSSAIDALKKRHTGLIIDDKFIRVGKELANCPHVKGWHKDIPRSCNSTKKPTNNCAKIGIKRLMTAGTKAKSLNNFIAPDSRPGTTFLMQAKQTAIANQIRTKTMSKLP